MEMSNPHPKIPFSLELLQLLKRFEDKKMVSIRDVDYALADRGAAALTLVLALPLTIPLPLPGASVVIGLFMVGLAYEIVRHRPPRLPKFILDKTIEYVTLVKIIAASCKILKYLERFLRPRLQFMTSGWLRCAAGVSLASSAIALSLPLPPVVPFTNGIPAFAIIFLALGFLEDDGIFIFIGHVISMLSWVYIFTLWEVLERSFRMILEKFF